MNQGSAKKLIGNIYNLTCFISDKDNQWEYEDKLKVFDNIRESETWLKNQGKNYGVNLIFKGGNFGLEKDIKFSKIEKGSGAGNERVDWISKVLYKVGYKSTKDFYDWCVKNGSDNVYVLIFAKGHGRGYAMKYSNNMSEEKYFVEGAILYEKYQDGQKLFSSSIVHETLHLFGAWDLYETFEQSKKTSEKAEKLFPNSVMRRISHNINDLNIDKVTAWRVGWQDKSQSYYKDFTPAK